MVFTTIKKIKKKFLSLLKGLSTTPPTPPPPPTTGKARGWHADLPTKTKAELAADRRQTP